MKHKTESFSLMHGNTNDRRALEREALRNVINQWNANRLDLFELSEPNEDLEFHGVMRFYFQDSGQKVATKCIRVASDATVEDVIGTLVEKFRPDMRMLSIPSYALYELHEGCPERRMLPDEKPLLVQLNWHVDDREGRFLLKNIDDKTSNTMSSIDSNASFRRKLSKREKKQLKKQEKLSKIKNENGNINEKEDGVAEKLYTELPETSFTRSISNPEAVMRRRRQQKLEKKLQQFRSKDGGPDTGGTLKIYGEALCKDVPYKTLLLSVRDCAGSVVREMLDKYGLHKTDPSQWCLVQVTQQPGIPDTEYILDDDECPLSILMNSPNNGSIMFHVRRRPADCAPRKRKKKPGALGANTTNPREIRGDCVPVLIELGPDGSAPHPGDTARTIRLTNDVMEVGSANGIALQLYGPHIQPRHCVITNADGVTSLTPCHADASTYVNGQRIHQTTILNHGALIKFGHSNTYRFLDPSQEDRNRYPGSTLDNNRIYDSRSPRALSPVEASRENIETTFDLEGNVETISTASGARDDNRSLESTSENRIGGMDRYPRGQDPILPAVLEFPEEPQEQFLARVITHLDVTVPTFRLAPAYTLYLCARYRASTHYRPELTPTERAHKLTVLLQHAAMLIRHTIQDRSTESTSQAFWLANASELLHFLKSDRHVSAFSLQAQDTLADGVQLAFKNLIACITDELNSAMIYLMSVTADDHPREVINVLSGAMNLLRKCRVNAALTIQLFSQLFHWISAKALMNVISNSNLCTRSFGNKLYNRLRNLQAWAESQGLELAAECHLAKIVQCTHLLQAPKYTPEELANLSSACFKLNSLQLGALLKQYKPESNEKLAPIALLEQAAKAAESVADELARAEGREVTLYEDPAPNLQLLLPDDGFSCDVVQGVPPGLADFLHPLQASGLCRLAAQPTSSGHWTVYMTTPRPPSALSTTQPEVQVIRLHKTGGGMGLSIVAAKGAGQERLGIYIKSVVPGGAADRDGRLAAGDQLLSVDGQSLLGITQEKAAEFLVRTGSIVTLEVAKGGAVYHGLATLLQQPSPTPHRAYWDYNSDDLHSSEETLYDNYRLFTPPVSKPKNNVFFNSDDNLYKREMKKFTIPRIEIESIEPVFNLQVTDFSEPSPKNMILSYDATGTNLEMKKIEISNNDNNEQYNNTKTQKDRTNNFVQNKSFSIDIHDNPSINIDDINETDKYLSISKNNNNRKMKQHQKIISTSLQDLSSSTSSINSGIHDSNLDLSHIDTDASRQYRNWKSPDEIRFGAQDNEKNLHNKAISYPELNSKQYFSCSNRSKSVSEEKLNDKLTEYERLEILKLLHDWSLEGSNSKTDINLKLLLKHGNKLEDDDDEKQQKNNGEQFKNYTDHKVKFSSESDLIKSIDKPKLIKYESENNINSDTLSELDFIHKCEYRNCIFNERFWVKKHHKGTNNVETLNFNSNNNIKNSKPKSILKNSRDKLTEIGSINTRSINNRTPFSRRYSEIINTDSLNINNYNNNKSISSSLIRCDSLESLISKNDVKERRKFPESYIITKSQKNTKNYSNNDSNNNNNNSNKSPKRSPKIIVFKKVNTPKTWKSCSDIKNRKTIRKCCRLAKKNCPITTSVDLLLQRKTQSCIDIEKDYNNITTDHIPRLASLVDDFFDCRRRMSERDLPSRVDSERTIPSSKSVPALHNIPPNAELPRQNPQSVFNPGYSRTSSNNSININSVAPAVAATATSSSSNHNNNNNNGPIVSNSVNMRSRSTHNLHQQQDGGFYQNLSVYRNKIPSPQHLGDRSSALRSSQNSLQSSVANSQRPSSAYYPQMIVNTNPRSNLHQSIPNLKSSSSVHKLHNVVDDKSGSYTGVVQYYNQNQNYSTQLPPPQQQQQHHPDDNRPHNLQLQSQNYKEINNSYPSPTYNHNTPTYTNNNQILQQHSNGQERFNNAGLLREDVYRQSSRMEDLRYLNTNNHHNNSGTLNNQQQNRPVDDIIRTNEMKSSKSDDMLKNIGSHSGGHGNIGGGGHGFGVELMRFASSGNIKTHESSKVEIPLYRSRDIDEDLNNKSQYTRTLDPDDMVKKRLQNRPIVGPYQQQQQHHQQQMYHSPPNNYHLQQQHQHSQQYHHSQHFPNYPQNYSMQMTHNTASMQNLNLGHHPQQSLPPPLSQQQQHLNQTIPPASPTYKSPPIAPKPTKKQEELPELPPTTTHPLYSASAQDPPKMAFYPTASSSSSTTTTMSKTPRDPWAREEQERQAEARREASRQWQEQQIRELLSLPQRTPQQEEQLRVLQLEREFQRRALEAAEQDDDDTEKESPSPTSTPTVPNPPSSIPTNSIKPDIPPTSILKPGANIYNQQQQIQQSEPVAPPPPERGSSFAVMSMRVKENTKRVSFNDASAAAAAAASSLSTSLQLDDSTRGDPNSFLRQAESLLASPTTPTEPVIITNSCNNITGSTTTMTTTTTQATPGVIGAQEVYRDPRARRLAEQAQQKSQTIPAVPEKLSFKEKMKMFAMETGEQETPKDKSKISRAQREIDNLATPPNSGMVH